MCWCMPCTNTKINIIHRIHGNKPHLKNMNAFFRILVSEIGAGHILRTCTLSIPRACVWEAIRGKHDNGIQNTVNKTYWETLKRLIIVPRPLYCFIYNTWTLTTCKYMAAKQYTLGYELPQDALLHNANQWPFYNHSRKSLAVLFYLSKRRYPNIRSHFINIDLMGVCVHLLEAAPSRTPRPAIRGRGGGLAGRHVWPAPRTPASRLPLQGPPGMESHFHAPYANKYADRFHLQRPNRSLFSGPPLPVRRLLRTASRAPSTWGGGP